MIVVVCGSRGWTDSQRIWTRLSELPDRTTIIEGDASGADRIAGQWATSNGWPLAVMPANWGHYYKLAGHIRNGWMLDLKPDLVIAFQKDRSSGTQNTIDEARRRGIPVEVHEA